MSVPEISVVLPCFNELANLPELRRRLVSVLEATGRTFEILFVDDGSRDGSFEAMTALAAQDPRLRALR
ncbi:MAG TPA: glycosyltransferase, partial [Thermoanaerobaculia bacterium]|nr:glycosyltransferase [Thermoanaerobaculia bacterium]